MSCTDSVLYQSEVSLPGSGWSYDQPASFEFEIKDTSQQVNMLLNVSHSDAYQWQNLYLKLYTDFPGDRKDTQILSVELADKTGRWYGERSGTTITAPILLQDHIRFELPGTYRLRIEQNMRVNPVPDVSGLELVLEKSEALPAAPKDKEKKTK